jgi:hypothetical protein
LRSQAVFNDVLRTNFVRRHEELFAFFADDDLAGLDGARDGVGGNGGERRDQSHGKRE